MIRAFLLLLAAVAAPAATGLTVGDTRFERSDVLDARALPEPGGPPVIMITFSDAGIAKLTRATTVDGGGTTTIPVRVDGKPLNELLVTAPLDAPVLTLTGPASITAATAVAKAISGKDPLPETGEE